MILPERLAEPLLTTGLSWFRRAGSCFLPTIYENLEMGASSKAAKAAKKDFMNGSGNWFPKLKDAVNQRQAP